MTLLMILVLPSLANTQALSRRAVCANNLSRIGRAFNQWAAAHSERYPITLPYWLEGTLSHPSGLANNAWFQFAWVSNELATPTVLACPSDSAKRPARNFGSSVDGGYVRLGNGATSYTVSHPFLEQGRALLSTDRHLIGNAPVTGCPYFAPAYTFDTPSTRAAWSRSIHVESGNVLFNDGSVGTTDAVQLRAALMTPGNDGPQFHYLNP